MSVYFPGRGAGAERTSEMPVLGGGVHMPYLTGSSARARAACRRAIDHPDRTKSSEAKRPMTDSSDRTH
jgi:hypothetical protein